jgi:hypothetical protein
LIVSFFVALSLLSTSLYVFGSHSEDQAELILQRLLSNKKLFRPHARVGTGAYHPFGASTNAGASSGGGQTANNMIVTGDRSIGGGGGNANVVNNNARDANPFQPSSSAFGAHLRHQSTAFNSEILSDKCWCQTFTYMHPEACFLYLYLFSYCFFFFFSSSSFFC